MTYAGQVDGVVVDLTVEPGGLRLGARVLAWTDLDRFRPDGHTLQLGTVQGERVSITHLGATRDRFLADAVEARARARRAAVLAWTGDAPIATFRGRRGAEPVTVCLFPDGVTIEPLEGAPDLVPFGCLDRVVRNGYDLTFVCRGLEDRKVSRLGRRTDEFLARLADARTALAMRVDAAYAALDPALAGLAAPDGWALDRHAVGPRWASLHAVVAGQRRHAELALLEGLAGDRLRLGIKAGIGSSVLPFALAPHAGRVVVEATDADDRATFVFASEDVDRLNAVLLLTSFRREAIAAPADRLGRWALAERLLPSVRWARAALVARVVHGPQWEARVRAALAA